MAAHWVVIAAAALTTLVAAAVGAALAAFAGQALPQAVKHDLATAPGTALIGSGSFSGTTVASTTGALRSAIGGALSGVPYGFWQGEWSNPLSLVPGALPARPADSGKNTPLLEAASLDGIRAHAVLVAGAWPSSTGVTGVIPAALPATAAALLKLHAGEQIRLQDRSSNKLVTFEITGLYAQRQLSGPAASYWQLNDIPASGSTTESGFNTYGPLVVAPTAFSSQLAATAAAPDQLNVATGTWVAQPNMSRFSSTGLSTISASVGALIVSGSNSSTLSSVQLTSKLPSVLADTGSNLAVARSLLTISALQLIVLALAALVAIARLLAAQREGETALLTARGATRRQLIWLTAAEVIPLSLITALAGGAAGVWLARLLGGTLDGSSGSGVSAGAWLDAMAAAFLICALAIGALLYPVLRVPTAAASRARRGRQVTIAGVTRAGTDLALIVLAVLAGWQLRHYSAVTASASGGAPSIDPVLALAPALALAGGTVLTLRLLPAGARATDRLAARGRGLTRAMAGWQFSRQPLRQGGAALLLVMAVATGTLALAQHASWSRSAADQAAFTTGGDVRVDLAAPLPVGATTQIAAVPGVRTAMAAADTQQSLPANVLAIDSAKASQVVRLRPDEAPVPASALFAAITPKAQTGGNPVPGKPTAVDLTATLSPVPIGPVTAEFTVTDADGAAFQLSAQAPLPADGRPHVLTVPLGGTDAAYPLRIAQVTLTYTLPEKKEQAAPATLTIGGATTSNWIADASSGELDAPGPEPVHPLPSADPQADGWQAAPGGATLTFDTGYGVIYNAQRLALIPAPAQGQVTLTAANSMPKSVPAIVTRAFTDANKVGAGGTLTADMNGVAVPIHIVAVADTFPTVTGSELIVDLPTVQAFLISHGAAPFNVTQWWLATDGARVPPSLARVLPPGAAVTSRDALTAAVQADPLSAAPQQALLAMAVAAALLAITGFWVSIAADVRQRRAENALLAALGITQRAAAAQLFLEKLLLSIPSAVLGLVLGTVVARLLVPAVTLTVTAQAPVPPPDTLLDLSQTAPLAAAVALLPALAAALVVFRRPDPASELRAAEAA
jgi:ABC-type antimicrobial peptide transport system permease subunit